MTLANVAIPYVQFRSVHARHNGRGPDSFLGRSRVRTRRRPTDSHPLTARLLSG